MPITGNTSGGGGRGFIIPTITWNDLKTQIEGDGAIKNFYNVTGRPNSGTDPLTVEVINTGGTAVSSQATVLRTRNIPSSITFEMGVNDAINTLSYVYVNGVIVAGVVSTISSNTIEENADYFANAFNNQGGNTNGYTATSDGAFITITNTNPLENESTNGFVLAIQNVYPITNKDIVLVGVPNETPEEGYEGTSIIRTIGTFSGGVYEQFSHACNYDFLNDVINWELDTKGNYYNSAFVDFPFDTLNVEDNDFKSSYIDFTGMTIVGDGIKNNNAVDSSINLTNCNIDTFSSNEIINSDFDASNSVSFVYFINNTLRASTIIANNISQPLYFRDNVVNKTRINISNLALGGYITNNSINLGDATLTLIRPIQNKIINLETSNYENDFTIDGDNYISFDQTPSHNWSGIVDCGGYDVKGVFALDKAPKRGIIKNATLITSGTGNITASNIVIETYPANIVLDQTNWFAEFYNDGTNLIITNVVIF